MNNKNLQAHGLGKAVSTASGEFVRKKQASKTYSRSDFPTNDVRG
jgi:hypothetical protein